MPLHARWGFAIGYLAGVLACATAGCRDDPGADADEEALREGSTALPGVGRLATLHDVLRLPDSYAVSARVRWTGLGDVRGRDHDGVFVQLPAGPHGPRLAVADSNGYRATYDGLSVRTNRGNATPAASGRDSAEALVKAFRIDYTPYGLAHSTGWEPVGGDTAAGTMTFARPLAARRAAMPGATELLAEIDIATGLPRKVSTRHGLGGFDALTIVETYRDWRPAAAAGTTWPGM